MSPPVSSPMTRVVDFALQACERGDIEWCPVAFEVYSGGLGTPKSVARARNVAEQLICAQLPLASDCTAAVQPMLVSGEYTPPVIGPPQGLPVPSPQNSPGLFVVALADSADCVASDTIACMRFANARLNGYAERFNAPRDTAGALSRLDALCASSYSLACREADCIRKPAEETCLQLAHNYLSGSGAERNPQRARELAAAACRGGLEGGCTLAGQIDDLAGQNAPAATFLSQASIGLPWLRKLAEECDKRRGGACVGLSVFLVPLLQDAVSPALLAIFRAACQDGGPDACMNLAGAVARHGPRDVRHARMLQQRSLRLTEGECEIGLPLGCSAYAELLLGGGAKRDTAQAIQKLDYMCSFFRDAMSCARWNALAFHVVPRGEERDRLRSGVKGPVLSYARNCDVNSGAACQALGRLYTGLGGIRPDTAHAIQLYMRACSLENDAACAELETAPWRKTSQAGLDASLQALRQLCATGHPDACVRAGDAVLDAPPTTQQLEDATELYRSACEQGEVPGCDGLAVLANRLRTGEGLPTEISRASSIATIGCHLRSENACKVLVALGEDYEAGTNGRPLMRDSALALWITGCTYNSPSACTRYAKLATDLFEGNSLPKNESEGRRILELGCSNRLSETGVLWACNWWGWRNQFGFGGEQNTARADSLYAYSCAKGLLLGCENSLNLRFGHPLPMSELQSVLVQARDSVGRLIEDQLVATAGKNGFGDIKREKIRRDLFDTGLGAREVRWAFNWEIEDLVYQVVFGDCDGYLTVFMTARMSSTFYQLNVTTEAVGVEDIRIQTGLCPIGDLIVAFGTILKAFSFTPVFPERVVFTKSIPNSVDPSAAQMIKLLTGRDDLAVGFQDFYIAQDGLHIGFKVVPKPDAPPQ